MKTSENIPQFSTKELAENYQHTLDYLFRLQRMSTKLGLDNIRTLLEAVNNPHTRWPAIHIAGTNGKGSTAAIIESILLQRGYKVGLYTSPHLVDFRERIRVNREQISMSEVISFAEQLRPIIDEIQPSFFEVATAMAFACFADRQVDVAIVETGMGGRLDSTNVVQPLITLITSVDFDHQNYLGATLREIAREKSGIIKEGIPCITANEHPEVVAVLAEQCEKKGSSFEKCYDNSAYQILRMEIDKTIFDLQIHDQQLSELTLNLPGQFQVDNALLAVSALYRLSEHFPVGEKEIRDGLTTVAWKGRIHKVSQNPDVIIDVSHNPQGIEKTLSFLHRFYSRDCIHAITFLQEDKDYQTIARLLASGCESSIIVDLQLGKPLSAKLFCEAIRSYDGKAEICGTFNEAYQLIRESSPGENLWLIIGSHYLAGEAYKKFND